MATLDEANSAFFAEFMKCISTEQEEETSDVSMCLITNEPLKKYAIRLKCGHSFNYAPLAAASYEYKRDIKASRLPIYSDTYCPYCREKTTGLLPYVPTSEKIHGVNMPHKHSFGENQCKHIMANKKECGRLCYFDKCYLHLEQHTPVVVMCSATTKSGKPCKNKASVGNSCKLHLTT